MTMRALAVLFGMSCLLLADDEPKQKVQVTHTERVDFPSGGQLRLRNSVGELTVEGWDRPDVEITTIKSTKDAYAPPDRAKASQELGKVRISVGRQGKDVVITTDFPRRRILSQGSLLRPGTSFDLEYRIKVPMNARLAVDRHTGEVHVENLASDIHVIVTNGEITLHLPQDGLYGIDAKSHIGSVTSDFSGSERSRPWPFGHRLVKETPAAHNLYLRVGFGDITIFKIWQPPAPSPVIH